MSKIIYLAGDETLLFVDDIFEGNNFHAKEEELHQAEAMKFILLALKHRNRVFPIQSSRKGGKSYVNNMRVADYVREILRSLDLSGLTISHLQHLNREKAMQFGAVHEECYVLHWVSKKYEYPQFKI